KRALEAEHLASPTDSTAEIFAGMLYASKGQRSRISERILAFRPAEIVDGDNAYWTAGIYALLGDREKALAFFRRAVEVGDHEYPYFEKDRNFASLRNDPEYQRILSDVKQKWEGYKREFNAD